MESTERAYYAALFRRNYREAQRLYRDLVCSDLWTPDRILREAHKCGVYDEADRDEPEVLDEAVAVVIALETRSPELAAA